MPKKTAAILGAILLAGIAPAAIAATVSDADPNGQLTPVAVVADYCAAWNTTDREKRDQLLKRVFASDGVYSDPSTYVAGRAELSNEIASFQAKLPGARFRCSTPQTHHNAMRATWLMLAADGKVAMQGMDYYELGTDGLMRRVTGFFGPPPEVSPDQ